MTRLNSSEPPANAKSHPDTGLTVEKRVDVSAETLSAPQESFATAERRADANVLPGAAGAVNGYQRATIDRSNAQSSVSSSRREPAQMESTSFAHSLIGARTLVGLMRGAAIGAAGSLVVAVFDSYEVCRPIADQPNVLRLWASDAGLVLPAGLILGICGALLAIVLHCPAAPSWIRLLRWLRPIEPRRRARLAGVALLAPMACVAASLVVAQIAVRVLSVQGSSVPLGAILAATTVGAALLFVGFVLAAARVIGMRNRDKPRDPVKTGAVGLLCAALMFSLLVTVGSTSGAGGSLAIFAFFAVKNWICARQYWLQCC